MSSPAARSLLLIVLTGATSGCVTLGRFDAMLAKRNDALDANRKLAAQVEEVRGEYELSNEARGNERTEAARARAEQADQNAVLAHLVDELTAERNVLGARVDRPDRGCGASTAGSRAPGAHVS